MLSTLQKYIDEAAAARPFPASLWARLGGDRRFAKIMALSLAFHAVFYAGLIRLSMTRTFEPVAPRSRVELVELTEVAPPPRLRAAPEALERADLERLEYDPRTANDTNLVSRSPDPGPQTGARRPLPSGSQIEDTLRATRARRVTANEPAAPPAAQPPQVASLQPGAVPQPDPGLLSQERLPQGAPAPPAPRPAQNQPAGIFMDSPGPANGEGSGARALGFEEARGQYLAQVRAQISRINDRIKPRDFIRDILNREVSARFDVTVGPDGRILSVQLTRPSGYKILDDTGRQAIFEASPFRGYPPGAGASITFNVTLYYFPIE